VFFFSKGHTVPHQLQHYLFQTTATNENFTPVQNL